MSDDRIKELATEVAVKLLDDYDERGGDRGDILSENGIAWIVERALREALAEELAEAVRLLDISMQNHPGFMEGCLWCAADVLQPNGLKPEHGCWHDAAARFVAEHGKKGA